jgi:type II pantothenate kinase
MYYAAMQTAIDFGISNIDVVVRADGALRHWTRPANGTPTPELVAEVLSSGGLSFGDLRRIAVTGGQSRALPQRIGTCEIVSVGEIEAIGLGGRALVEAPESTPLLIVSAGSGTAMVVGRDSTYRHVTGSAVGGGTLLGLARLLLGTTDPLQIDALAQQGDPNRADLSLADVVVGPIGQLPADATAVNFGRLARNAEQVEPADLAAALVTLIGQVIAMIAINAAKAQQIERIVVIGRLTALPSIRKAIAQAGGFYGVAFELPPHAAHATALGALRLLEQQP